MPKINISLKNLSETIRGLNENDIETLLMMLSDKDKELSSRMKDIKENKVKTLSRDEVFDV